MKVLFRLFISLAIILVFSGQLLAVGPGTVSVVTESWENCTNKDGTGLYFDMLRKVFEPNNLKVSYKIMPYNRSTNLVVQKQADVVIGPYADELEGVIYPKDHISSDIIGAVFLKGSSWNGEKTLLNKKVIWMRGYAYNEYLSTPMKYSEVDSRDIAMQMLLKKRVDFFLDAPDDTKDFINNSHSKYKLSDYEIKEVKKINMFVCFANTPKGKQLAAIWDTEIPKLIKSGALKQLFIKWEQQAYYNF